MWAKRSRTPTLSYGYVFFTVCLLTYIMPYTAEAQGFSHTDRLTSQDVSKIVSLLGGQIPGLGAAASAPVPAVAAAHSHGSNTPNVPSPDELVQQLSLISNLLNSGSLSSDAASLLGLGSLTTPTTTTSTTENPKNGEAAMAQFLTQLLAAGAGGGGGLGAPPAAVAASPASNNNNDALAALLGLAAGGGAGSPNQQAQSSQQGAAEAALLTNLLSSLSAGNAQKQQPSAAGAGLKQQDFTNFQNAGASLDGASSNQLNQLGGVLSLLGTLGGLASPQPSLFNLGGQQQANPLASLLGGGGGGAGNLLAGLLGGAQQQSQRPGFLSSLGNLATVVGSAVRGQQDEKPKLRGVDTRLGLGYRFGENADAQVVWEIGPQLFTEPLTDEQKAALLQQQQLLQKRQNIVHNSNRRMQVINKNQLPTTQQTRLQNTAVRRTLPKVNEHIYAPSQRSTQQTFVASAAKKNAGQPGISPSVKTPSAAATLTHMMQPPISYNLNSRQDTSADGRINPNNYLNYYAKEEANPRTNKHSQLTEYEIWLLRNPNAKNSLPLPQQQQIPTQQTFPNTQQRKDFTFSKDNSNNIVRVRIQPRQGQAAPVHVKVVHAMGNGNGYAVQGQQRMNPTVLQRRTGGYTTPEDSYAKRNAMVINPTIRDIERQRERQQHVVQVHQRRRVSHHHPQTEKRAQTLSEWSEKNGYLDFMKNYLVNSIKNEGNKLVKTIFSHPKEPEPTAAATAAVPLSYHVAPTAAGQLLVVAKPSPTTTTEAPGIISSAIKGLLGLALDTTSTATAKPKVVKPIIRVGDQVSYDELASIMHGEAAAPASSGPHVIPTLNDAHHGVYDNSPFPSQNPEIFIDIANGEVSMRKAFGTMQSYQPPPPEPIPEGSPKHVFNVLKEQLKEEYQRVKMEQMKEAAKQIRKDNIATGLSNPHDPIYMANNFFDLVEKDQLRKRTSLGG